MTQVGVCYPPLEHYRKANTALDHKQHIAGQSGLENP